MRHGALATLRHSAYVLVGFVCGWTVCLADTVIVESTPDDNDLLRGVIIGQFGVMMGGTIAGFIPEPFISSTGEVISYATDLSLKFTPPQFGRLTDKVLHTNSGADRCHHDMLLRQQTAEHTNLYGLNVKVVPEEQRLGNVVKQGYWGSLVNSGEMFVFHLNSDVVVGVSGNAIDATGSFPQTIRLAEGAHRFRWAAETQLAPVLDVVVPPALMAIFADSETEAGGVFSKYFSDTKVLNEIIANPANAGFIDDAVAAGIRSEIWTKLGKDLLKRVLGEVPEALTNLGIDVGGIVLEELGVPTLSFPVARNYFEQSVIVLDRHTPTITTTQPALTKEATDLGGTRLVRIYDELLASLQYSDPCGRATRISSNAPNILPIGTTEIEWTVTDLEPLQNEAQYYEPGVRSTASLTQTVTVADTQPPIIVAPAGKVVETQGNDVNPANLYLGWPLVIDLADPAPVITNDAPATFPNDSRLAVDWTATDGTGNAATQVQWVTGKSPGTNTTPRVASVNALTRTADLVEIRLNGIDNDVLPTSRGFTLADPLAFEIVDYPDDGQFEAPLRPFFIEDFRLTPIGETEIKGVRTSPLGDLADEFAALPNPADPRSANAQRGAFLNDHYCEAGEDIPLDFVFQPTYVHVTDDGIYYVRDKFWDCDYQYFPDFPGDRISKWSSDREYLGEFRTSDLDGNQSAVFTVDDDSTIWWTDTGPDISAFISSQDLNRIDQDLNNHSAWRFSVQPEVVGFEYGITAVHADQSRGLIYVNDNVGIEVYRLSDRALLGRLEIAGEDHFLEPLIGRAQGRCQGRELVSDGGGSARYWMATDSAGNLYMSDACEDLIHKFAPSEIGSNGAFEAGEYVGWLGRCAQNIPPWSGCDERKGVSRGFTCAVDKCTRGQTYGTEPGQFEQPTHLAMGPHDILYVADFLNLRVQRFGTDGTFAGAAQSTGTGINVGEDPGFVLGNMGPPKSISVNSASFYVMEAENDADFFLHRFETIPFHMIEAGNGEIDRDSDGFADNSVLLKYRSDYNFPGSSGRIVANDGFTYRVNDGLADSPTVRGTIVVLRNFRPPEQLAIRCYEPGNTATQVACVLDEDTALVVELVAKDPDGVIGYDGLDSLSYSIVRPPTHGRLEFQSADAGSAFYLYTPDPDFNGADGFRYSVNDGTTINLRGLVKVEAAFDLEVLPVPDAPVLTIDPPGTGGRGFPLVVTASYTDVDRDPDEPSPVVHVAWGDGTLEPQGEIVEVAENEYEATGPLLTPTVPGAGSIVASHTYPDSGRPNMTVCLDSVDSAIPICKMVQQEVVEATRVTVDASTSEPKPVAGSVFPMSVEVTNQLPEHWAGLAAPGVSTTITIPGGLVVVTRDARCAPVAPPGTQVCTLGNLAAGETAVLEFALRANALVVPVPEYRVQAKATHGGFDINETIEDELGIEVVWADVDADEIPDAWELAHFSSVGARPDGDADRDGLTNYQEYRAKADPNVGDTDSDGKQDGAEALTHYTSPFNSDTDGDRLPDGWELDMGLDPFSDDSLADNDADGLANAGEYRRGTEPKTADTDGDQSLDLQDNCPVTFNPGQLDLDADGLGNRCDNYYAAGLVSVPDLNANGVDEVALLWTKSAGGVQESWVDVTDSATGQILSRRPVLDAARVPRAIDVVTSPRAGPRLVISSEHVSDGWPVLDIVDARWNRTYAQTNSLPIDSELLVTRVLPPSALAPTGRLAVLVRNTLSGKLSVVTLDAGTGQTIGELAVLEDADPGWSVAALEVLDSNGEPALAVLVAGYEAQGVVERLELRRVADGAVLAELMPAPAGYTVVEMHGVADVLNDGTDDLAIRLRRIADGQELVRLINLPGNTLLSTVSLAALQAAPAGGSDDSGIAQFAVVDVAGDPALAALVVSEGALTVHVLDLFTGATLYEVPFSGSPMAYRNHHTALARLGTTTPLFAAVLESRDTTAHVVEVRELETGMIPPAHVTGPRVIKEGGGGSMGVLSLLALLLAQLLPWRSRRARDLAYTSPI